MARCLRWRARLGLRPAKFLIKPVYVTLEEREGGRNGVESLR